MEGNYEKIVNEEEKKILYNNRFRVDCGLHAQQFIFLFTVVRYFGLRNLSDKHIGRKFAFKMLLLQGLAIVGTNYVNKPLT